MSSFSLQAMNEPSISVLSANSTNVSWFKRKAIKAAIVAAQAFFSGMGYYLSAELLGRAKINRPNQMYYPVRSYVVKYTTTFAAIALAPVRSGDGGFVLGLSLYESDAYFAIRLFNYTKTSAASRTVTITDTYDFGESALDFPILDRLVGIMITAQSLGYIIPYDLSITQTLC